jgi:hypothetical protein
MSGRVSRDGNQGGKQDRQCTHDVILRRIRVTSLDVEKQYYLFCVCVTLVIRHAKPMCRIILSSVATPTRSLSSISHKGHAFRGKKVIQHKMCVLIFTTSFVRNNWNFENNWARYYYKFKNVFMSRNRYSCQILMRLEFSRHIFGEENSWNNRFNQNLSSGCSSMRTDRHDVGNSHFSQFYEHAFSE